MSTISACMIVRDEEELLPACLESIKELVDEIILVDTGSTDKTKEIAEEYGAKIYDLKWDNDFSSARNFAMSKATSDWVFTVDADERVEQKDIPVLKKMLPDITQDTIGVNVLNLYGPNKTARGQLVMMRFFRRSSGIKYIGRVHNRPVVNGDSIITIPFKLYHLGYDLPPEDMVKKDKRRVSMCKVWTEEEPNEAQAWFHYANALKTIGGKLNFDAFDDIIKILKKGLAVSHENGNNHFSMRVQILNNLAWMYHATQRHDEAVKYGLKALAIKPDYIDAILVVGLANTYGISALSGEQYLLRYLREVDAYSPEPDCIVMEHANDKALVYRALVEIEGWKEKNNIRKGI